MANKSKVQSVEPDIADLVNGWLKSYGLDYKLEQASLNSEIDKALDEYHSKSGGKGGNRPDAKLLLKDKYGTFYPVLIEYKGYKDKTISANGANTGATFYQSKEFTVLQDAYALKWVKTSSTLSDNQHLFLVSTIRKTIFGNYAWTNKAGWERIKNDYIKLPTKNGKIDFEFMESFIEELEAYLSVSGLKDTQLTADELSALDKFNSINWKKFNLETLFGKSTRGKRLKGDDRIGGNLPFVTAGETDEGISAFISNDVEIFSSNTTTIDMFGSAKYRNYNYGADDHIAVVHTENLSKYAAIFVTSACHKSAHNGDFSYSRNFYAKDADKLYISLPVKNEQPDYELMSTLISAMQKLVIADVVKFSDEKIKATKQVVG